MKRKLILIIIFFWSFTISSSAQSVNAVTIGDELPEETWNSILQVVNHPDGKSVVNLNEYRHKKLIILEFWATYCTPCIKSLDKLNVLKDDFPNELVVLPILVYDLENNALPFMNKKSWKWPSIVNNTFLTKVVFSRYLTGFGNVWILDGKVLAVPNPNDITKDNILKVLSGHKVAFRNGKKQF